MINNVEDSNLEESKLTDLFSFLEFDVEVRRRHAMIQICEVAQEFSRKDHSAFDSFVFIVMSQTEFGSGEHIVGVDGRKVTIEQVMSDYKASSCRSLKGKPKLFFVLRFTKPLSTQLVESHDSGFGARVCTDSAKVLVQTCNTAGHDVCPEEADFMLACATSPTLGGRKRSECSFIRVRHFKVKTSCSSCSSCLNVFLNRGYVILSESYQSIPEFQVIRFTRISISVTRVPLLFSSTSTSLVSRNGGIQTIGHFRVHVCLLFKESLSAKFLS